MSFSQDFGVREALGWREGKTSAGSQVVGIGATARKPISPTQVGHPPRMPGPYRVRSRFKPILIHLHPCLWIHPWISGAVPSWPSLNHHSSLPTNSGEGEIDLPSQLLASLREREVACLPIPGGALELRGNDGGLDGTVGPGPLLAPNGLPHTHTYASQVRANG